MCRRGFTLIELIVVIAIIALLLTITLPSMKRAKEMALSIPCLANQRTIAMAFHLYQEENNGWLVTSGAWWVPNEFVPDDPLQERARSWVLGPLDAEGRACRSVNDNPTVEHEINGIKKGTLWPYIESKEAYHCPADKRVVKKNIGWRSYSMPTSIGCWYGTYITQDQTIHKMNEIKSPGQKYISIEEAEKLSDGTYWWNVGSWVLDLSTDNWYDPVADWHNWGGNLAYADGHAEKRKWRDKRTINWVQGLAEKSPPPSEHLGSVDLEYMLICFPYKR